MNVRSQSADRPTVAILGGGISGLAAAHELKAKLPAAAVTLFESSHRCGGVLQTESCDGFLIEQSADSFLVNEQLPWAADLAHDVGMADELIAPNPDGRRALIACGDKTPPVPEGFYLMAAGDLSATWQSPILTRQGKWRLWAERFVRQAPADTEESLEQFATRRVGKETYERLVQPLVSGIYSADPAQLSVAAALPQFIEMERKHGSLTAGLKQRAAQTRSTAGARYQMFRTPRGGLQSLIERVESSLDGMTINRNQAVTDVRQSNEGWAITSHTNDQETEQTFDAVISAVPAPKAATILANATPKLAAGLNSVEHVGVAVVCLGYHRDQIGHPLDAFGLVVPAIERRDSIAISFSSIKFPDRAPRDHVLIRVFLGGALRPDLVTLDEGELVARAANEAASLLRISGTPLLTRLNRWQQITPQYHIGHAERIKNIEDRANEIRGFALAGNVLRGVGIPQCVRSGKAAAEKIVAEFVQT